MMARTKTTKRKLAVEAEPLSKHHKVDHPQFNNLSLSSDSDSDISMSSSSSDSDLCDRTEKVSDKSITRCDICNKTFKSHLGLTRHNRYAHQQIFKSFRCNHCYKSYSRKDVIQRHLRNMHGLKGDKEDYDVFLKGPRSNSKKPIKWKPPFEASQQPVKAIQHPIFKITAATTYVPSPSQQKPKPQSPDTTTTINNTDKELGDLLEQILLKDNLYTPKSTTPLNSVQTDIHSVTMDSTCQHPPTPSMDSQPATSDAQVIDIPTDYSQLDRYYTKKTSSSTNNLVSDLYLSDSDSNTTIEESDLDCMIVDTPPGTPRHIVESNLIEELLHQTPPTSPTKHDIINSVLEPPLEFMDIHMDTPMDTADTIYTSPSTLTNYQIDNLSKFSKEQIDSKIEEKLLEIAKLIR